MPRSFKFVSFTKITCEKEEGCEDAVVRIAIGVGSDWSSVATTGVTVEVIGGSAGVNRETAVIVGVDWGFTDTDKIDIRIEGIEESITEVEELGGEGGEGWKLFAKAIETQDRNKRSMTP